MNAALKPSVVETSGEKKAHFYLLRSCGDCDVCCRLMPVAELNKPSGVRCEKMRTGPETGCSIYEDRPNVCRVWACVWRSGSNLFNSTEEERPDRSGIMLDTIRQVPDKPYVHALLAYEVEEGAFRRNSVQATIMRLARKFVVVIMKHPRVVLGPKEKVEEFNRLIPCEEL